jgi:radical SAM modification target selenobiotic family peptide
MPVASFSQYASNGKEGVMETKDLKKFLAGFGIAGLLAGAGLAGASGVALAADQPGGSG